MSREDFHSTDLAGAAYYAGIYGDGLDPVDDRPSRVEAEFDQGLFVLPASWEDVGSPPTGRDQL